MQTEQQKFTAAVQKAITDIEAAAVWAETDKDFEEAAQHVCATAGVSLAWRWSAFGGIEFF